MDKIIYALLLMGLLILVFFIYGVTLLSFYSKKIGFLNSLIIITMISFIFGIFSKNIFSNSNKPTIILFLSFTFILFGLYFYRNIEVAFSYLVQLLTVFDFDLSWSIDKISDLKNIGTAMIVAGLVFLGEFFIELFS